MGFIGDYVGSRVAVWRFRRSKLGQALIYHTREYFYSDRCMLSSLDKQTKLKFQSDFMAKLIGIMQDPNPIMALRTAMVEYTLLWADIQILCLKEAEKPGMHYGANPYISGELHHRIMEAANHVDETAQFLWQQKDATAADIMQFANGRSAIMLFYMNGLNMARIELQDYEQEKDWFRPLGEACLVASEHRIRQAMGMPLLIGNIIGALPYTGFYNWVLNGDRNPFFTWTRSFPEWYLAGEGPLPEPAQLSKPAQEAAPTSAVS